MRSRRSRRTLLAAALAAALAALLLAALDSALPPPIPEPGADGSTVVLAADGSPLRAFTARDGVWRYPIALDQVSPRYIEALIGYEDRHFLAHPGVNPWALLRATGQALRHGRVISGGSTLSMQAARLIEPIPRTPLGKLKQILRALQLERRLSKEQILTLYLQRAPFGGNLEGVAAASWAYLGKSPLQLSHSEAALLAVLPQAPSRLRPDRHATAARDARDKVLRRLAEHGIWPAKTIAEAADEPVSARRLRPPMAAALLAERVRREAPGEAVIHTTIDARLQRLIERRVAAHMAGLPAHSSAAVLVVEHQGLATRAYVGSASYGDRERLGHIDMVRARRSPGSTLKPFIYALALDDGLIHSQSLLVDAPQDFNGYKPSNFGDLFRGPVSAADALKLSLNVPAVDLLERVTPARLAARLHHARVDMALPRSAAPNLTLALGGVSVALEDLTGAYAALARDGQGGRPRLRPDEPLDQRQIISAGAAFIVREMLTERGFAAEGSAGLDTSRQATAAVKTGTSYGFRDAWAIGVTPRYTIGVWIGRPDGTPMPGHYGAVTALPLWTALAEAMPRASGAETRRAATDSVARAEICWPLGGLRADTAAPLCHQVRDAWILAGNVPPTLADRHDPLAQTLRVDYWIDPASGLRVDTGCAVLAMRTAINARWPSRLQAWLDLRTRARAALPAWSPACAKNQRPPARGRLRIAGGIDGTVLKQAPGSHRAPSIDLRALDAEPPVTWLVNDRLVGYSEGARALRKSFANPGEQRIVAIDAAGHYDRVVLRVAP